MTKARLIILVMLCVLFVVFVLQNSSHVNTRFLMFSWTMPKAMLICISVLAGVVLGIMASMRK